jgi:site-specific DNA recombinase
LARLDSTQMRKAMTSRQRRRKGDNDAELLAQIGMLDQRLAELAIVFTAGDMSATAYGAATRELEGKSDELANRLATLHQAEPFAKLLGEKGGIRSVWTQLDSERKRVIIQSVVDRVIVHPVGRGHGHHFRPERLEPIWRV